MMLLQIDVGTVIDSAKNVQPGDNSGYTFAVVLLSVMFMGALLVIRKLYFDRQLSDADLHSKLDERSEKSFELFIQMKELVIRMEQTNKDNTLRIVRRIESVGGNIQKNESITQTDA